MASTIFKVSTPNTRRISPWSHVPLESLTNSSHEWVVSPGKDLLLLKVILHERQIIDSLVTVKWKKSLLGACPTPEVSKILSLIAVFMSWRTPSDLISPPSGAERLFTYSFQQLQFFAEKSWADVRNSIYFLIEQKYQRYKCSGFSPARVFPVSLPKRAKVFMPFKKALYHREENSVWFVCGEIKRQ